MNDSDLDALLYPTMVSRPSRIGEPQRGSNCSLAPNSGTTGDLRPGRFHPRPVARRPGDPRPPALRILDLTPLQLG